MATYAIGDVQGCFDSLTALLETLRFDAARDRLWFTGDLVNRGPRSLDTLRFVRGLGDRAVTVLGNHDLHLLGVACGVRRLKAGDTLSDVLEAPDCNDLIAWLRRQPLLHRDAERGVVMVHAGLPPQWTLDVAQACASAVETKLRGGGIANLMGKLSGDQCDTWSASLPLRQAARIRRQLPDPHAVLRRGRTPGVARKGAAGKPAGALSAVVCAAGAAARLGNDCLWPLGQSGSLQQTWSPCAGHRLCVGRRPHRAVPGNRGAHERSLS